MVCVGGSSKAAKFDEHLRSFRSKLGGSKAKKNNEEHDAAIAENRRRSADEKAEQEDLDPEIEDEIRKYQQSRPKYPTVQAALFVEPMKDQDKGKQRADSTQETTDEIRSLPATLFPSRVISNDSTVSAPGRLNTTSPPIATAQQSQIYLAPHARSQQATHTPPDSRSRSNSPHAPAPKPVPVPVPVPEAGPSQPSGSRPDKEKIRLIAEDIINRLEHLPESDPEHQTRVHEEYRNAIESALEDSLKTSGMQSQLQAVDETVPGTFSRASTGDSGRSYDRYIKNPYRNYLLHRRGAGSKYLVGLEGSVGQWDLG